MEKVNKGKKIKKYPPFAEEFIEWCINNGLTKKSAGVYISNIRAAYYNFCYWHKGLLEGIEKAFNMVISKESVDFIEIECWIEGLNEYIEDLNSLKNGIVILDRNDDWKDAPVSEWINAFNNYRDFLRFKQQTLEHEILGGPAPKTEIPYTFPLKKWFFKYLREIKMKNSTIWTYSSRLNKSILCFDVVSDLRDFIESIPDIIKNPDSHKLITQKFDEMNVILDEELNNRKILKNDMDFSDFYFSYADLQDAKLGIKLYKCFLRDVIKNREKYSELLKDTDK